MTLAVSSDLVDYSKRYTRFCDAVSHNDVTIIWFAYIKQIEVSREGSGICKMVWSIILIALSDETNLILGFIISSNATFENDGNASL